MIRQIFLEWAGWYSFFTFTFLDPCRNTTRTPFHSSRFFPSPLSFFLISTQHAIVSESYAFSAYRCTALPYGAINESYVRSPSGRLPRIPFMRYQVRSRPRCGGYVVLLLLPLSFMVVDPILILPFAEFQIFHSAPSRSDGLLEWCPEVWWLDFPMTVWGLEVSGVSWFGVLSPKFSLQEETLRCVGYIATAPETSKKAL